MDEVTIFDKILSREVGADVVYENEYVLAFRDINPAAPIHVLVMPKRKIASLDQLGELEQEHVCRFFQSLPRIAEMCALGKGYRVVINTGADAQQSVQYLHAHILGGRKLEWPPG